MPLFASVFLLAVALHPHLQGGPKHPPQTGQSQQRGTDSLPVAVKLLNTGKSPEEAAKEDRRAAEVVDINRLQYRANIWAVAIAFLSVLVVGWTFHQSRKTNRQQLRAYVGLDHDPQRRVRLIPQSESSSYAYEVWIKNFGHTPAYHVGCTMTRKVLNYPLPFGTELVEDADEDQLAGASPTWLTLQPGESRRIVSSSRDPRLTGDEIRDFINGKDPSGQQIQLYCYGTISYGDAFGRSHWIRYGKSFGGDFYRRYDLGSATHMHNDSSDDPQTRA